MSCIVNLVRITWKQTNTKLNLRSRKITYDQIPPSFKTSKGIICNGLSTNCMLLKRLAYPCRYSDMVLRFAKSVPAICMFTNKVQDYIYNIQKDRIMWKMHSCLLISCKTILLQCTGKVEPLTIVLGSLMAVRHIGRPERNQRILYNGHKRVHNLKFQSVVLPNGLVANMYGSVVSSIYIMLHYQYICNFD